jgi:cell division protein FtsL
MIKQRKKQNWQEKIPFKKINAFFCALWILSAVFYLMNLNAMNAGGYRIKEVEKKISMLEKESEALNLDLAERQSMERIMNAASVLGMVDSGRIQYVNSGATAVAKK